MTRVYKCRRLEWSSGDHKTEATSHFNESCSTGIDKCRFPVEYIITFYQQSLFHFDWPLLCERS